MQLWTHHPSHFRVDASDLIIDAKRGQYWADHGTNFRYRALHPVLCSKLGTDQFLWCCTIRGMFIRTIEAIDIVEWELNVPESHIIAYIRVSAWEALLRRRTDQWEDLIPSEIPRADKDINALVSLPLLSEWITRHGPLAPQYPKRREKR